MGIRATGASALALALVMAATAQASAQERPFASMSGGVLGAGDISMWAVEGGFEAPLQGGTSISGELSRWGTFGSSAFHANVGSLVVVYHFDSQGQTSHSEYRPFVLGGFAIPLNANGGGFLRAAVGADRWGTGRVGIRSELLAYFSPMCAVCAVLELRAGILLR